MGNLFDLIASIGSQPVAEQTALQRRVELLAPDAANDPHAAVEAPAAAHSTTSTSITAPVVEAASGLRRNAWTVTRNGAPICRMVGQPMTRTDALAAARWRWPDTDILEF